MNIDIARDIGIAAHPPLKTDAPAQPSFHLTAPPAARTQMAVTKRSGEREPVDVNKIVRAVARCCEGLSAVDPMRVALKTIAGLFDGATTRELDELSIRTAASFMVEEPEYSKLGARLLSAFIDKEVQGLGVYSFSQSIRLGFDTGLINERVLGFVEAHARKLNDTLDATRTAALETATGGGAGPHPCKRFLFLRPDPRLELHVGLCDARLY